ncbi:MAG TPA: NADH-ubiquinone oxidoreductase-F iron-sulfur binding region domain-containing protein [Candidatus Limnocylindrales bacterium]|nr:NADH-ubiquinone oxidoreductase-F iron-sulfur binding region domain-containing protein [Candidatus Limnocylindrales bacterium]
MTTFLQAPREWASVLLARADRLAADPSDLDAAVRAGAFDGLKKAVRDLGATGTIATVAESGLRGRGGAGFSTAEKWRAAADRPAGQKYVIANGYGADPAVRTDAALLAADPWSVIEGLAIAAFSVGATDAILAVRGEDTALVTMLDGAVLAAEEAGFLGDDAAGSGHRISVTVRPVQGAYMLGEETVLIKALEGKRGQPDQRPPYPTEKGLFEKPTVVNNVQTLAAVPWIAVNGGDVYATIGAKASPGTVLVQLRGPEGAGIAEVPLGTPLRELVTLAGGTGGRTLKAVLVGGPTGGLLPADALDTPYAYEDLAAAGAHIGSGSVVIVDERACVVDLARLLTKFSADAACGKSIPCRIGLRRLYEIGDRIAGGTPKPTDATLLGDLSQDIAASALCDHERLATLPFTSAMRYFRSELDDHLLRSTCPAGVCAPIVVGAGATAAGSG